MSTTQPRIVAITEDAALVIGLTFAARDWDVASQPELEAGEDADVVVLDLNDAGDAVDAVQQHRLQRVVVLGDEDLEGDLPAGVVVLPRPYTVEELVGTIDHLLAPQDTERPVRWTPSPAGHDSDDAEAPADAERPAQAADDGAAALNGTAPAGEAATMAPRDHDAQPEDDGHTAGEGRRPLVSRLMGRLFTSGDPGRGDDAPPATANGTNEEAPPPPVAVAPDAEPEPADHDGADDALVDLTEPEPQPRIIQRTAAQAGTADAPSLTPGPIRRTRWRARHQRELSGSEQAFRERLGRVLAATSELERLVEEVPLLEDLTALTAAIVREVSHEFDADSTGLWRPGPTGWKVSASRGFSVHERRLVVPFDQPLFAEVHASGGSMLIDPVESVQAAVAGIGGAHTESFMAAAIAAGPGRYGIIAVGRNTPLQEPDLDRLAGLVLDMAPGIAVAEQLERLRGNTSGSEHPRTGSVPTGGEPSTIVLPETASTSVG